MIELKPCPFCGGKAEFDEVQTSLRPVEWSHKVICPECYVILAETSLFKTKEEASKAWNTRTSGWIPCSERMPENETEVLIFCPDFCDRIKKAMFIEDGFYEERTDLIVKPGEYCTHWMPLPEPPESR